MTPIQDRRDAYYQQMSDMVDRVRAWHTEHPDAVPVFRWKYPRDVAVIALLGDALAIGIVDANADGQALLDDIRQAFPDKREPTITMFRVALEVARGGATPKTQ